MVGKFTQCIVFVSIDASTVASYPLSYPQGLMSFKHKI
jgi:hypothetical protein